MQRLYLIFMIILVSSILPISATAQDDALELTQTVQFIGLDYLIDYPEGWTSRVRNPSTWDPGTWIEEVEFDAFNRWVRRTSGIVIQFQHQTVPDMESIGIEDGTLEELMNFYEEPWGWEMTNIEAVQIFGVDALRSEAEDQAGTHLIYLGFLDEENIFLLDIVAPDEGVLAEFLPTWEEMLLTIREGTRPPVDLRPTPNIVPDDITLFSSYDEFTQVIDDIKASSGDEATALVDTLWDELTSTNNIPLAIGNVVVFFYRGDAESVDWFGEFTVFAPYENYGVGEQVGDTDLWMSKAFFVPTDTRFLYYLRIGEDFTHDPANPNTFYPAPFHDSVLTMPEFEATTFSVPRDEVDTGTVSEILLIDSENMGYSINYQVYTPFDYDSLSNLPSIYLLDGDGYAFPSVGDYPTILDNMIADGLIEPVIAVFIHSSDQRSNEFDANPNFARFIAEELVPTVDAEFTTDANASSRAINGLSLGGSAAAYIALQHPDVFENIAMASPVFWELDIVGLFENSSDVPFNIFMSWGPSDIEGIPEVTPIAEDIAELGFNVETMQVVEGHNFLNWRDVSDETLIFFFCNGNSGNGNGNSGNGNGNSGTCNGNNGNGNGNSGTCNGNNGNGNGNNAQN